jgi:hypothetical protein
VDARDLRAGDPLLRRTEEAVRIEHVRCLWWLPVNNLVAAELHAHAVGHMQVAAHNGCQRATEEGERLLGVEVCNLQLLTAPRPISMPSVTGSNLGHHDRATSESMAWMTSWVPSRPRLLMAHLRSEIRPRHRSQDNIIASLAGRRCQRG